MLLNLLLQAGLTVGGEQATADGEIVSEVSLKTLIYAGGWVMIPLGLLALAAIYLFIERLLTILKATKNNEALLDQVRSYVSAGQIEDAQIICQEEGTPAGRMLEKGISRIGNPLKDIETSIENAGKIEINRLEKNLSTLATISGAAPMIGFLGTVLGMIQAFIKIKAEGTADIGSMAGGIYEALVTTASGLIVGVIAYMAYNYLAALVQKVVHNLEHSSVEFIDLLQEPQ